MKKLLIPVLLLSAFFSQAQHIKNIYLNLYTDSLKKGTYNYINVDGKLPNGNFTPLDSTELIFWASDGKFYGNSLLLDKDYRKQKVEIKVTLRSDPSITKTFTMFIKRNEDNERLKTNDELLKELQNDQQLKHRKKA